MNYSTDEDDERVFRMGVMSGVYAELHDAVTDDLGRVLRARSSGRTMPGDYDQALAYQLARIEAAVAVIRCRVALEVVA